MKYSYYNRATLHDNIYILQVNIYLSAVVYTYLYWVGSHCQISGCTRARPLKAMLQVIVSMENFVRESLNLSDIIFCQKRNCV